MKIPVANPKKPGTVRVAAITHAFDFIAFLVGREQVSIMEITRHLGCHVRTVYRYAHAAEQAGLIEWRKPERGRGFRFGESRSSIRLLNPRLRRCA